MKFTSADVALIRAAASLAAHTPEKMRAAHLAPRLEDLARRVAAEVPKEEGPTIHEIQVLRAA